jgi:hypothetical protein
MNEIFTCENVFVPLRSDPSHKSEMLSQVLFGERYEILEQRGHWMNIRTLFDNYTGWIDSDHVQHSVTGNSLPGSVLNRSLPCYKADKTRIVLEAGCEIHEPDFEKKRFTIGNNTYLTPDDFGNGHVSAVGSLTETGLKFINSPYIWGGRIPSGIDCSGFTQLVFKIHGINIPRDSRKQAGEGITICSIDDSAPGDLVFFDDEQGKITHVGMIFSTGLVIHASGRVRIDTIDNQGIYKNERRGYSHRLCMIKRVAPPGVH